MNETGLWHLGFAVHLELPDHGKRRRACRIAPNAAKLWSFAPLAKVVVLAVSSTAVLVSRSVEERWPNPGPLLLQENQHQNHQLKVRLLVPAVKELQLWLLVNQLIRSCNH